MPALSRTCMTAGCLENYTLEMGELNPKAAKTGIQRETRDPKWRHENAHDYFGTRSSDFFRISGIRSSELSPVSSNCLSTLNCSYPLHALCHAAEILGLGRRLYHSRRKRG